MTATEQQTLQQQLVEELYRVEGKAEIINGEIVHLPMTGRNPNHAAFKIAMSLWLHVQRTRAGDVATDGLGFLVDLPHRASFAPDAAYFTQSTSGMRFVDGAPDFAVEVRSEGDYGPAAERDMAEKRADYFATGTKVVWDVDLLAAEAIVRVFRDGDAIHPAAIYRHGQTAEAEPAVPGWSMLVDDLFRNSAVQD